jgi:hypothetical protein
MLPDQAIEAGGKQVGQSYGREGVHGSVTDALQGLAQLRHEAIDQHAAVIPGAVGHVDVAGSGLRTGVTEQFLDATQVQDSAARGSASPAGPLHRA